MLRSLFITHICDDASKKPDRVGIVLLLAQSSGARTVLVARPIGVTAFVILLYRSSAGVALSWSFVGTHGEFLGISARSAMTISGTKIEAMMGRLMASDAPPRVEARPQTNSSEV